jgi:hypothetical protein
MVSSAARSSIVPLFGLLLGGCGSLLGVEHDYVESEPTAGAAGATQDHGGGGSHGGQSPGGGGGAGHTQAVGGGGGGVSGKTGLGGAGSSGAGGDVTGDTCTDGVKNGQETGVDCGGPACGKCPVCAGCLRIRVGPPVVVRQQAPSQLDSPTSYVRLASGGIRAFVTGWNPQTPQDTSQSWQPRVFSSAIDGPQVTGLGGSENKVLLPKPGSYSDCGAWLYQVQRLAPGSSTLVALVHNEDRSGLCNLDYQKELYGPEASITYGTASLAVSDDEGLTWVDQGAVLTNGETAFLPPAPGQQVGREEHGLNNCGMVAGHDGFMYAYCSSFQSGGSVVARASLGTPPTAAGLMPGGWSQWQETTHDWSEPGLKGAGAIVPNKLTMGQTLTTGSYWADRDAVLGLRDGCEACQSVNATGQGGIQFSVSDDRVHFTTLLEPLVPVDAVDLTAHPNAAPTEATLYSVLLNDGTNGESSNLAGGHGLLAYTYRGGAISLDDPSNRHLIFHDFWITENAAPLTGPQMGLALTNWASQGGYVRSTTGVVLPTAQGFSNARRLGWLLTNSASTTTPSVSFPATNKLEECVSNGNPLDYILALQGSCQIAVVDPVSGVVHYEGPGSPDYHRVRTAGFTFAAPQSNTLPLYRCKLDETGTHFATTDAAECVFHQHEPEAMLGYLMTDTY